MIRIKAGQRKIEGNFSPRRHEENTSNGHSLRLGVRGFFLTQLG